MQWHDKFLAQLVILVAVAMTNRQQALCAAQSFSASLSILHKHARQTTALVCRACSTQPVAGFQFFVGTGANEAMP